MIGSVSSSNLGRHRALCAASRAKRGWGWGAPLPHPSDVRELAAAMDPIGPDNALHLEEIIREADVLVPCWGSRTKLPKQLHLHLDNLMEQLVQSGKPVMTFGLTNSGDPKHPLTLGYDTPLVEWESRS